MQRGSWLLLLLLLRRRRRLLLLRRRRWRLLLLLLLLLLLKPRCVQLSLQHVLLAAAEQADADSEEGCGSNYNDLRYVCMRAI